MTQQWMEECRFPPAPFSPWQGVTNGRVGTVHGWGCGVLTRVLMSPIGTEQSCCAAPTLEVGI